MPRKRGLNKYQRAAQEPARGVTHLANGGARVESRRGSDWFVRDIPVSRATKIYACPGCHNEIPEAQAHLVVWSAEHMFGDEAAVRDRRHWHSHCWQVA